MIRRFRLVFSYLGLHSGVQAAVIRASGIGDANSAALSLVGHVPLRIKPFLRNAYGRWSLNVSGVGEN